MESFATSEAHRAAWWCAFLKEGGVSAANQSRLATLQAPPAANPANAASIEGIAELEEFAAKILVNEGQASDFGHAIGGDAHFLEILAGDIEFCGEFRHGFVDGDLGTAKFHFHFQQSELAESIRVSDHAERVDAGVPHPHRARADARHFAVGAHREHP
jgi:hypothetical protein